MLPELLERVGALMKGDLRHLITTGETQPDAFAQEKL